ncbi:MAG TPA: DUF4118 domain-containing protein, partial [Enhygromyxa sp.]|nr:DUF4118 domain-containing protein [Enhygromyxa sp.]
MRYASAPLLISLVTFVQYLVLPEPHIAPYLFYFCGVAVCSWLSGRWPGVLAALLSAVAANYFFVAPLHGWSLTGPAFTLTGLFLISA